MRIVAPGRSITDMETIMTDCLTEKVYKDDGLLETKGPKATNLESTLKTCASEPSHIKKLYTE